MALRSNYVAGDYGGPQLVNINGLNVASTDPAAQAHLAAQRENNTTNNNQGRNSIRDLMDIGDPFGKERKRYKNQLRDLMSDPSAALENNPYFSASNEAGMEAARRRLAQMGMGASGNAALELQRASQANLSQDYFRMADLLGRFAGANADPSAGARVGLDAARFMEDARRYENERTPNVFVGGTQVNQRQAPVTLGDLSAYWR